MLLYVTNKVWRERLRGGSAHLEADRTLAREAAPLATILLAVLRGPLVDHPHRGLHRDVLEQHLVRVVVEPEVLRVGDPVGRLGPHVPLEPLGRTPVEPDDDVVRVDGRAVPRALLWCAVNRLVHDDDFLHGMRLLYDANQIVSFLYNSIVPHLEERLRFTKLQDDYDRAMKKPENIQQNTMRFEAITKSIREADVVSTARKVSDDFAVMRRGVRPLSSDTAKIETSATP